MAELTEEDRRLLRYKEEIDLFFKGKTYDWKWDKGHIWVCSHENGTFETLTVEPPEGGQYEIAVRLRRRDEEGKEIFCGYYSGILFGHNTDGH